MGEKKNKKPCIYKNYRSQEAAPSDASTHEETVQHEAQSNEAEAAEQIPPHNQENEETNTTQSVVVSEGNGSAIPTSESQPQEPSNPEGLSSLFCA
jgi:hypothetical protein